MTNELPLNADDAIVDDRGDPVGPIELCGVCGKAADGFASINGVRVCHSDERSCYVPR